MLIKELFVKTPSIDNLKKDRAAIKSVPANDYKSVNTVNITVHNIKSFSDSGNAYKITQTNDDIKDGDVLWAGGGNTAVMVKGQPTMVTGKIQGFHFLKSGTTWGEFENGKFKAAADKAAKVAQAHGFKA